MNNATGLATACAMFDRYAHLTDDKGGFLSNAQTATGWNLAPQFVKTVEGAERAGNADGLTEVAAHYMLVARAACGGATDPVARFHLGNGARLEMIPENADTSARGQRASWGVMVNYLYDVQTIERNHEAYINAGQIIASPVMQKLLKSS